MNDLPVIKPPLRGNDKLGAVLTESRETGPTCPLTCPLYQNETCYSKKLGKYHTSVQQGMRERETAHMANREAWIASRVKAWTRETAAGRPVRFLVHGDLMAAGQVDLDWDWINDVVTAAGQVPGFRGWIYSHTWRLDGTAKARDLLQAVGITFWASVHSPTEAREARERGFNVTMISEERKAGYKGKAYRTAAEMGTDRPAIVCIEQLGKSPSCERCGFCFQKNPRVDLVLLKH